MIPIAAYTDAEFGYQGDLPDRVRDAHLGRTLEWSDALRGFYFFGTGEVVRAGYVRRHWGARFEPAELNDLPGPPGVPTHGAGLMGVNTGSAGALSAPAPSSSRGTPAAPDGLKDAGFPPFSPRPSGTLLLTAASGSKSRSRL